MDHLTAVILAGGLGTRLRSVVADRPKVLADVGGRPFLAYLFDQLISCGIKHVVLCTGYLGEQITAIFGNIYKSLEIEYSQEHEPLGTGGALRHAYHLYRSDPVLAMNGDSFCTANFPQFYRWYREITFSSGGMLLTKVANVQRYGQVQLQTNGQISAFNEKGQNRGVGWINSGIYLLPLPLLESIPENCPLSLEKDIFPIWLSRGLYGFQSDGNFIDIGIPDTYFSAEDFFAQSIT